jgi:hypothetical protein
VTDAVAVSAITAVGVVLAALIQSLARRVDGRLTELLNLTKKSSHAEGMKDQKEAKENGDDQGAVGEVSQ